MNDTKAFLPDPVVWTNYERQRKGAAMSRERVCQCGSDPPRWADLKIEPRGMKRVQLVEQFLRFRKFCVQGV